MVLDRRGRSHSSRQTGICNQSHQTTYQADRQRVRRAGRQSAAGGQSRPDQSWPSADKPQTNSGPAADQRQTSGRPAADQRQTSGRPAAYKTGICRPCMRMRMRMPTANVCSWKFHAPSRYCARGRDDQTMIHNQSAHKHREKNNQHQLLRLRRGAVTSKVSSTPYVYRCGTRPMDTCLAWPAHTM